MVLPVVLFVLVLIGGGGDASVGEAPLKENMTLTYDVTQSLRGKSLHKIETVRFEKTGENQFLLHRMVREDYGDYEADPLQVDSYFIYNEVLTANVGGNDIWNDPKQLVSGKLKDLGKLKITQGTYNGRDVYILHWDDHYKAYYAKDTGLFEGSVEEIRDKQIKETIVRVH